MDTYAVVGNPITHSKSPEIHKIFAEQTKQLIRYSAMLSDVNNFENDIHQFFKEGGLGLNITVPFKIQAYDLANQLSKRAQLAGAVNTLIFKNKIIIGDNTDGYGLIKDLLVNCHFEIKNKKILLIGAGGASQGVIGPLLEENPESISIVNRTDAKAEKLVKMFLQYGEVKSLTFNDLSNAGSFDLLINASSAGLSGEAPKLPVSVLAENTFCYDMVYSKTTTPFIDWAKSKGCTKMADGLGMLVEQAAESFFLWRDVRPETKSVLKKLRESL